MDKHDLNRRLLQFGVRSIHVANALTKSATGRHVGLQLMRAATSAGANYCEASGAESRQDFLHKMQISLKELRESEYWLRLIAEAGLLPAKRLTGMLDEADQLIRIFVAAVTTYKSRKNADSLRQDELST